MIIRVALLCTGVLVASGAKAQVPGCTDPLALNFDPSAETNDGSCMYAPTGISPYLTQELPTSLSETSGLIDWDGHFWTHNDDTDIRLYALDPQDASIADECLLAGVINQDWEDIDQDDTWIYVGDFGNNSSGNRQDLHILRIEKSTLCTGQPQIDTLWYSYEDQIDFSNQGSNTTDYDCEAMVVGADSIYLFTKQWKSLGTAVYALSKLPGDQIAELRGTWPVNGLITGATWMEGDRVLALCGYSSLLQPFLYVCYDYQGHSFFSGNKRRLELTLPFHQIEGISTTDGLDYTLSNERFSQIVMVPPRLHHVDLVITFPVIWMH
ncbi:MAG: T9SS C-terminal target domain-containing protein [Saprospiraceae bacterium]|nr:T9SS C-terminal target domain-containing protein [Saprospiraceae bacterium]